MALITACQPARYFSPGLPWRCSTRCNTSAAAQDLQQAVLFRAFPYPEQAVTEQEGIKGNTNYTFNRFPRFQVVPILTPTGWSYLTYIAKHHKVNLAAALQESWCKGSQEVSACLDISK